MPTAAPRACLHPGCRSLVKDARYCEAHRKERAGSYADEARGTRQARGYGAGWEATRKRILSRDAGICQECLRNGVVTPIGHRRYSYFCDHIIPKAEGGSDDDDNLQALCRDCHDRKTQREAARGVRRGAVQKSKPQ
jgi:5-methylcytosine-specific restriction protein A